MRKHARKSRKLRDEYKSRAKDILEYLAALFTFLSYLSERAFLITSYGLYPVAFLEGAVIVLVLIAAFFYIQSKRR